MILFVVLGIFILIISFVIAFVSLIREQRENFDTEESVDSSPLQKETVLLETQREPHDSISKQSTKPVQSDVTSLPSEDIVAGKVVQEDHLKTASTEAFPWEQKKEDTFGQDEDFIAVTKEEKSTQKLSGEISRRDIAGESENQ